ncbi:Isoleucine--tRNA ligase, mitochondrial [Frankliniella fusca]|uniref:isoleucine--tRNA ligase n=1 Tax=Frankliniella fusca TaxID=407009 RepID=A0AAE1L7K3_9NEOP|nr:Isoleucine--tRNA ligase, mitochondrial [Frankliniella fusca]
MLVSDNGPPFDSNKFAEFCTNFNVKVLHSPPYCPEANGLAERCVSIAKKGMEKIILSQGSEVSHATSSDSIDVLSLNKRLSLFLYHYRNTPTTTTTKTPNELLLSYKPRTMLSQLVPTSNTVSTYPNHFREGDRVKFKLNERSPTVDATIVRINGNRYLVSVEGVQKEVHFNQLSRAPIQVLFAKALIYKNMSAILMFDVLNIRSVFASKLFISKRRADPTFCFRFLSSKDGGGPKKSGSKYKDTLLLPKTEFPLWLDSRQRAKHDLGILNKCGFSTQYNWQRENIKGTEFVLHDGPPYANGSPHVGHAVNKILKDIIIRNELLQGKQIHYVPGWDCHGLPIEMKALSASKCDETLSPLEIRQRARKFASEAIENQRKIFSSWGILADWENNCYFTYNENYVKNQLRRFFSLYEEGLVYRDMKPIYWSPSSRTALAEAELQYNKNHVSTCVTLRLKLLTKPFHVELEGPLYALVWTTTPWTLPANEAVTYRSDINYSIVKIENLDGHYIVASNLVPDLEKNLSKLVKIEQNIQGKSLKRVTYAHPIYKEEVHRFFHADHVTDEKGTGLVHCAPSHGREDYIVAVENKLKLVSLVDKEGNYIELAGADLVGKNIMGNGAETVQELLKTDIIHTENLVHSYPYDWRTNKPVFLLASEQWFFDCSAVKETALEILNTISYAPDDSHSGTIKKLVKERPFWCISRQRAWGVPIPILFKRDSKDTIISKKLIEHYCDLIDKNGTDFWWTLPIQEILPPHLASEMNIDVSEVDRSHDILDIWFDSGLSWSAVLGGRTADLYLEGNDQLTGWFQSSLLTSTALCGKAPFKKIFTHGFVVDENGQKMSKSLGNVVDPYVITNGGDNPLKDPAFGVDTLRLVSFFISRYGWWVAAHSVQHANIPIGVNLIQSSSDTLKKLRGTIKYALGALNGFPSRLLERTGDQKMYLLDLYMLHALTEFRKAVKIHYANHHYNHVCIAINNFAVNQVSNLYFNLTKDRLYCDEIESGRRQACQTVMYFILETLLEALAPIAPILVEETYLYHPIHTDNRYYEYRSKYPLQSFNALHSEFSDESIETALEIKNKINKLSDGKSTWGFIASIQGSPENLNLLKPLMEDDLASPIQLTEILQVGSLELNSLSDDESISMSSRFQVELKPAPSPVCARCRRFSALEHSDICTRCMDVLDSSLNALKHSFH